MIERLSFILMENNDIIISDKSFSLLIEIFYLLFQIEKNEIALRIGNWALDRSYIEPKMNESFKRVKAVHKQFNSPIRLYSPEALAGVLNRHSRLLPNGAMG